MNRVIEIFDSTLRDGAQGEGISFSVEDKLAITRLLDELGVTFVEAGNPGSNPKDLEFFRRVSKLKLKNTQLVAFGSTRRKNIAVEQDANVKALLTANTKIVALFGKCWDLHVRDILRTTEDENLNMIADTVAFFKSEGKLVIFDAEHFFDGYKTNPQFALKALKAAEDAGADVLVLCDTNGGTFPNDVYEITKTVVQKTKTAVGIHAHNDGGMAVANSIMAVEAGAVHVQGTYLGFGERSGNANLSSIIANLQLKRGYHCIDPDKMKLLTSTARNMAEIANVRLERGTPYVGGSAFAHKAGMHADGVLKNSETFEHIPPEAVGNERRFLMSEISGRTAVLKKIQHFCPEITRTSPQLNDIIEQLKRMELEGYQYDGADASFELLVLKILGRLSSFFELGYYRITGEKPSEPNHSAVATLKIRVGEKAQTAASEGNGPVNALDKALRSALCGFYPSLSGVHLVDYKVRVMDSRQATGAKVRVLITSTDGEREWTTVGVSSDVIEASWMALSESMEYKLMLDNIKN
ncbi:MAG: citramalate synthase [Oscillospiraceae bacterium]|nr:citramalate synthase [Oscillospiraceae bacterium]